MSRLHALRRGALALERRRRRSLARHGGDRFPGHGPRPGGGHGLRRLRRAPGGSDRTGQGRARSSPSDCTPPALRWSAATWMPVAARVWPTSSASRSRRPPRRSSRSELDVLAPCAAGGLIDDAIARAIDCRVVAGRGQQPTERPRRGSHPDGARRALRARLPRQLRRADPRVARVVRADRGEAAASRS